MSGYLNEQNTDLASGIASNIETQYGIVRSKLDKEIYVTSQQDRKDSLQCQIKLLKEFFLSQNEIEQDPHAFGTVEINDRIKSLSSIKKNLVKGIKSGKLDEKSLDLLQNSDDPELWCKQQKDLIGVRVIVRSQRHKHQIYRAIRYLCELNLTERRDSLGIPFVIKEGTSKWKHFNPVIRAYYRPVAVQEFYEAIKGTSKISEMSSPEKKDLLDHLDMSSRHEMSFEFKNTGYSTLQRNLYFQLKDSEGNNGAKYMFEIQIRTVLEHAWAELEHKMVYKGGPLSEHVKGLFRNYGLSLSSADDTLQMIIDDWRRETDYHVEYSDRSLRIFEHLDKYDKNNHSKVINHNLARLYSSLSHGYVNDAVSIAQSLVEQQEPDSIKQAQFKIEEAVCRMCNIPFALSDHNIDKLLDKSIEIGEGHKKLEIQFFANFRKAQYYYLQSESLFVSHIIKNSKLRNRRNLDFLHGSDDKITLCLRVIDKILDLYKSKDSFDEGMLQWSSVVLLETHILQARCYERRASISNEKNGYFRSRGGSIKKLYNPEIDDPKNIRNSLSKAIDIIGSSLVFLRDMNLNTYNNVDIEMYNTKLWCLRLKHKYYALENKNSQHSSTQILDTLEDVKNTYNDFIRICFLQESITDESRIKTSRSYPGEEARGRLKNLIEHFMKGDYNSISIESDLSECTMFELKVLDTIIGLRLVFGQSDSSKQEDLDVIASGFSDLLRKRLVRIAAKGDFSFNSYFAYSLFTMNRLY